MDERRYLYRCDAGDVAQIGTGHLRRGLLLARELKLRHQIKTAFLVRENSIAVKMVQDAGFQLFPMRGSDDEIGVMHDLISSFRPEAVILDRLDSEIHFVRSIKEMGVFLITMDDHGSGAEEADILINAFDCEPNSRTPYTGPGYMILPQLDPGVRTHREDAKSVFLSFGGYDHLDLTTKTLRALDGLNGNGLRTTVVMRRSSPNSRQVESLANAEGSGIDLFFDVRALSEIMKDADIAVVCGGLTLFESMRSGLPSVVIAQYEHQLKTATAMDSRGAAICLGRGEEVEEEKIRDAVLKLVPDRNRREMLGERAQSVLNSDGLRVVTDLMAVVTENAWDTKFFRRKIATLHPMRLNEGIAAYAMKLCREKEVECLYYLADFDDPTSVGLAEDNGFHLVDFRLRMGRDLAGFSNEKGNGEGVIIRPAVDEDRSDLEGIADNSYGGSRFFFDTNFPREDCRKLYRIWIRKSMKGQYGYRDRVFVAEMGGEAVGFISCDIKPPSTGLIVLVGIRSDARGKSVGSTILNHVMGWMVEQGLKRVEVITQGRNLGAQALYQSAGFRTIETRLWYHKWFS